MWYIMALRLALDFLKSPSSCLFKQPLRGLTNSTLKFMRSTCGKSSLALAYQSRSFFSQSCKYSM